MSKNPHHHPPGGGIPENVFLSGQHHHPQRAAPAATKQGTTTGTRKRPWRWDVQPSVQMSSISGPTTDNNMQSDNAEYHERRNNPSESMIHNSNRWGRGRSSSTCRSYYEPTKFERYNQNDWRCSGCFLWNPMNQERCQRCNSIQGSDAQRPQRVERRPPPPKEEDNNIQWPPEFSANGSSYVFDARSNMFYDYQSNFFYDPKSTLYYGNKQQTYFKYNPKSIPRFQRVSKQSSTNAAAAAALPATSKNFSSQKSLDGGSICFDQQQNQAAKFSIPVLPTSTAMIKKKPKSSKSKPSRSSSLEPVRIKLNSRLEGQARNIETWTKRQEEKAGSNKTSKLQSSIEITMLPPPPLPTTPSIPGKKEKIIFTSKGEPICPICVRKFPSREKLRIHEELSELHKSNLVRLQQEAKKPHSVVVDDTNDSSPSQQQQQQQQQQQPKYVDRAKKRRVMYGEDAPFIPMEAFSQQQQRHHNKSTIEHHPPILSNNILGGESVQMETTGERSMGEQLFAKMIQKTSSNTTATLRSSEPEKLEQASNLRKEWQRIESLSQQSGQRIRYASGGGIGN